MKLRPPSPALVISIIALCVALGGSAYAATLITSKQIRNGTIQNVDIKRNTIQASRLSPGVQRVLRRGAPVGGSSVATGRVAYETIRKAGPENQPPGPLARVASLTVPAGAYVITANTVMTAFTGTTNPLEALLGSNGSQGGTCTLDAAGVTSTAFQTIVVNDRQTPATLGMQLTRTVGAPMEITLSCAGAVPWRLSETSIIASKVDSLTLTESTG
ncbi:MAG TPA: hypothetical protein VM299_05405 [Solirubrobacteraceae bacterium]|jgi:hypothetical protein|nr:hypothetical protein [Solirubrobacteraceae bacterium]